MPDTIESDLSYAPQSHQKLFSALLDLVEASTRLSRSQLALRASIEQPYRYRITARHVLHPDVRRRAIFGGYEPGTGAQRVRDPAIEAAVHLAERLGIATSFVASTIAREPSLFLPVEDVTVVDEGPRYFCLDGCSACQKQGSSTCSRCRGRKQVTCESCAGAGKTACPVYACNGGRVRCNSCSGSGQQQIFYTDVENGQQVSRTRWVTCNFCTGGSFTCTTCYHGEVGCDRCASTGSVGCTPCGASGQISCTPCAGTGHVGEEAFVAVELAPTFVFHQDAGGPPAISLALAHQDLGTIPELSSEFARGPVSVAEDAKGQALCVEYEGTVPVIHQQVQVGDHAFDLLAYGREPRWHELSHLIDHVLGVDLERLRSFLSTSVLGTPRTSDTAAMLGQLEQVLLSEANADQLFGTAARAAPGAPGPLLGADYAAALANSVRQAVGACYTAANRHAIPWAVLAGLATYLGLWAHFGRYAGLLALPPIFAASAWLAGRATRSRVMKGIASRELGQKLLALHRNPAGRAANRLALAACLAIPAALAFNLLPEHGPYEREGDLALLRLRLQVMNGGYPMSVAQVAAALPTRHEIPFDWIKARRSIELLAKGGNTDAAGLYGYLVYHRIGEKSGQYVLADQASSDAATPWIEAGLQRGDAWAMLAKAAQHLGGFTTAPDEQATAILTPMAEAGNLIAARTLATYYGSSRGADGRKAIYWYRKCAATGDTGGLIGMARLYWVGSRVGKNRKLAKALWKQAADAGNRRAQEPIEKALQFEM